MRLGFIAILKGTFSGGFWLFISGWFLNSGAQTYLQQNKLSSKIKGIKLKDINESKFYCSQTRFKNIWFNHKLF
jgi:hypothetical protein